MEVITRFRLLIEKWDTNKFFTYSGLFLLLFFMMTGFILFRCYRSVQSLKIEIGDLNTSREQIQQLFKKAQPVRMQQMEVTTMLKKDPQFKIGGYFKELLEKLGLLSKKKLETISPVDIDSEYRETELRLELTDMTIKDICNLLQEISQNPRLYVKDIDITRSKKTGDNLELLITVSTLHLKESLSDAVEYGA